MILGLSIVFAALLTATVAHYVAWHPRRLRAKRAANIARLERDLGLNASETPVEDVTFPRATTTSERARQRERIYAEMERHQIAYTAWRLAHNNEVWLPEAVDQRDPAIDASRLQIWSYP